MISKLSDMTRIVYGCSYCDDDDSNPAVYNAEQVEELVATLEAEIKLGDKYLQDTLMKLADAQALLLRDQ